MPADRRPAWGSPGHPDRIVFKTDLVTVGAFRCRVDDPCFQESGPLPQPCFVFPRTCTTIQYPDRRGFVADPTVVTMFNAGQRYQRKPLSREGDECDWYGVDPSLLRDALRRVDPDASQSADRLIRQAFVSSSAALYLRQRALFLETSAVHAPDELAVEEQVCALLRTVIARAYRETVSRADGVDCQQPRIAAVAAARALIARGFRQTLGLGAIARAVGLSPFQLSRSFHEVTGTTLHRYRTRLRLRASLEMVEAGVPLTDVALELGYSSHSHFTQAFRSEFGAAPSRVLARRRLARL